MDNMKFEVVVFDGELKDVLEPTTPWLQYSDLSLTESVELCRMSFLQGFKAIIWIGGSGND